MTDDHTIVANVQAGKRGAFEHLVGQHQKLVWHIVYRMTGNNADAEELAQETFLRVARTLGQFRFESKLSTWIGRVAYSVAVRYLERRRVELDDAADHEHAPDHATDGPQQTTARMQTAQTVNHALSQLPPLPRTIVSLFYQEGYKVAEIARITGVPDGTVKSHLARARKTLQALISKEDLL